MVKTRVLEMSSELSSVKSSLNGYIKTRNNLELYEKYNILTLINRFEYPGKVKIISGGGAGHEPAHSGFVGRGLLTTAVSGEVFTSPSVNAILAGILITAGKNLSTPLLLIVTNYTGDRLNFSLAEEIARTKYGYYNMKMIIVSDDVALENVPDSVGCRGLAGTVLIQKIAGAMSELGKDLAEIHEFCSMVTENLYTIGFSFKSLQNSLKNIEIGKGVHGEPGSQNFPDAHNFENINAFILKRFTQILPSSSGTEEVVVLFNNLGATSNHLFSSFVNTLSAHLSKKFQIVKIIAGPLFTSLNNEGISVSLLAVGKSKKSILRYLELESEVLWDYFRPMQGMKSVKRYDEFEIEFSRKKIGCRVKDPKVFQAVVINICKRVISNKDTLNWMDAEFGDGDCGSSLARGADKMIEFAQDNNDFTYFGDVFQNIGIVLSSSMGGTIGALLGIFFQAASSAFTSKSENPWQSALKLGITAMQRAGKASRGDRTMLDVLLVAEDVFESNAEVFNKNIQEFLKILDGRCHEAAALTQHTKAKSGRASYSSDNSEKAPQFVDPGASFVSLVFHELYTSLLQQ